MIFYQDILINRNPTPQWPMDSFQVQMPVNFPQAFEYCKWICAHLGTIMIKSLLQLWRKRREGISLFSPAPPPFVVSSYLREGDFMIMGRFWYFCISNSATQALETSHRLAAFRPKDDCVNENSILSALDWDSYLDFLTILPSFNFVNLHLLNADFR